jgi:2-deoxy-D-gluconate 3-dehydrogenase
VRTDVSEENSVIDLLKEAVVRFQKLDLLVNNAGISQLDFIPTEEAPIEEWDRVVRVNLRGTFLCCKYVGKHMIEQGGGNIINVASTAGFTGIPRASAYCASKAGVISLTKSLAVEWARYNIRVNAVAPHYLETELTRGLRNSAKVYEGIIRQIPLQRFARLEEVIGSILFLSSPASSYITGSVLPVDGGFLA